MNHNGIVVIYLKGLDLLEIHKRCRFDPCVGEGNGTSLQYSYLENAMDIGAWWATVQGASKTQTQLSTQVMYLA